MEQLGRAAAGTSVCLVAGIGLAGNSAIAPQVYSGTLGHPREAEAETGTGPVDRTGYWAA